MYAGTVILNRSEEAFWKMTPRQLDSLLEIHLFVKGGNEDKNKKGESKPGFIDEVLPVI